MEPFYDKYDVVPESYVDKKSYNATLNNREPEQHAPMSKLVYDYMQNVENIKSKKSVRGNTSQPAVYKLQTTGPPIPIPTTKVPYFDGNDVCTLIKNKNAGDKIEDLERKLAHPQDVMIYDKYDWDNVVEHGDIDAFNKGMCELACDKTHILIYECKKRPCLLNIGVLDISGSIINYKLMLPDTTHLIARNVTFKDGASIEGDKLTHLDLTNSVFHDPSLFHNKRYQELVHLNVSKTNLTHLPYSNVLCELDISGTMITDISQYLRLVHLNINDTVVADISYCKFLETLHARNTPVKIENMFPNLKLVNLTYSNKTNITCPLYVNYLNMNNSVVDSEIYQYLQFIKRIDMCNCMTVGNNAINSNILTQLNHSNTTITIDNCPNLVKNI